MSAAGARLDGLLAALSPTLQPGRYVFACLDADAAITSADCLCVMREPEGISAIVAADRVPAGARVLDYRAAWITLHVDSALDDIGLTAAVSACLRDAQLSCNVVAGARHDHLFVPEEEAVRALTLLEALARDAGRRGAKEQPAAEPR